MRDSICRGIAAFACVIFAGCSSVPPWLPPLRGGDDLSIRSPRESPPDTNVAATTAARSGAAGGVAGGTAGALAGLGCGFLAVICVPVFLYGGALVGGTTGALAGVALGPSRASLEELEQRLQAFTAANDPHGDFMGALLDKARAHWRVVPASARNTLEVRMTGLSLRGPSLEKIALEMRVVVSAKLADSPGYVSRTAPLRTSAWPDFDAGAVTETATFEYKGTPAALGQWMDESGDFLKAAIARAYEDLAQQIVAALLGQSA
jgi:hypothetical protein